MRGRRDYHSLPDLSLIDFGDLCLVIFADDVLLLAELVARLDEDDFPVALRHSPVPGPDEDRAVAEDFVGDHLEGQVFDLLDELQVDRPPIVLDVLLHSHRV